LQIEPDNATHVTAPVDVDLSHDRTLTASHISRQGCGFEGVERWRAAPEHRPRTGPTSGDGKLKRCFAGRGLKQGCKLAIRQPREPFVRTAEAQPALDQCIPWI
jgi:hypothetical protein